MIEKFRHLKPDVVVVSIYGGNDYAEIRRPYRFFHRLPLEERYEKPLALKLKWLGKNRRQLHAQFLHQAMAMQHFPEEFALMEKATLELVDEMQQLCEGMGSKIVLLYIPPLFSTQPQYQSEMIESALEHVGHKYADFYHGDLLTDKLKLHARDRGIPFLDLRGDFRRAGEFLYWGGDHHINIKGNVVVGKALEEAIRKLVF